ncbi:MAG: hypothetical protein JSS09_05010 [Verrucomicrobia bacterium]|nr:hypothetical protein [Verrucomicrobiota bacterium]
MQAEREFVLGAGPYEGIEDCKGLIGSKKEKIGLRQERSQILQRKTCFIIFIR